MIRTIFLSMLLVSCGSAASEEQAVRAAVHAHHQAMHDRDLRALRNLLTENYVSTQTEGIVLNKEQELAKARASTSNYTEFELDDIKIQLYRGFAVVTSRFRYGGTFSGEPFAGENLRTTVFLRTPRGWKVVAMRSTRVKDSS